MEQLKMSRDGGKTDSGSMPLPEGYHMRHYEKGDGVGWCRCCFGGSLSVDEISESAFENKMLKDKMVNPENIFFLVSPSGDIAGTATYQYTGDEDTGSLHMVSIEKSYQGKGLAFPLVLYAVQKMVGDGKKKITLTTDDWRIPAIKTYLRAGFAPVVKPGDAEMESRWANVMAQIKKQ